MAAPRRRVIGTMVDVGPDHYPLQLANRLTRSITDAAKAGEVNLSRQMFTHIPWTDKERGLVLHRVGGYQWPANSSPLHIVGIGKSRHYQLLTDELGESWMGTHGFRYGGLAKAIVELNHWCLNGRPLPTAQTVRPGD